MMYSLIPLFAALVRLANSQIVEPPVVPAAIIQEQAAKLKTEDPSPCANACEKLASQIPSMVSFDRTDINDYWDFKQSSIHPACKVQPESSKDVSAILSAAVEAKCHFAVKSGGHAREAHVSNADGGITIDLVRLSKVELSKDKKTYVV